MMHTGRSLLQEQSALAQGNSSNKFLQLRHKAASKLAQRDSVNAYTAPVVRSQPAAPQTVATVIQSFASANTKSAGPSSKNDTSAGDLVQCSGCSRRFPRANLAQHEERCGKINRNAPVRERSDASFRNEADELDTLRRGQQWHRANAAPIPTLEDMPAVSQATRQATMQKQHRDPSVQSADLRPAVRELSQPKPLPDDFVDPSTRVARAAHTPNFESEVEDHGIPAQARVERESCKYCQRQFAVDRLSKHMSICRQNIESEKNKQVADMRAKRIESLYAANHAADDAHSVVQKLQEEEKLGSSSGSKSSGKWRMESAQFQRALKGVAAPPADDDRVPCPHCGRKFSEHAAQRHIPRCNSKSKAPR